MKFHKSIKYYISSRYYRLRELMHPSHILDANDIPVIINNFNRLTTLRLLILRLEKAGCHNIHVIDNASTYPPLIEFYETLPYPVYRLNKNLGFKALWKSGLAKMLCRDYYVYTDSDVVPIDECPDDFMNHFLGALKKHKFACKVGFSLRIDNIPAHYAHKYAVITKESRYYERPIDNGSLFRAPIDTTFAMYRPHIGLCRSAAAEAYRTAYPYQAEHLPWYNDLAHLSPEEEYYMEHVSKPTDWSRRIKTN